MFVGSFVMGNGRMYTSSDLSSRVSVGREANTELFVFVCFFGCLFALCAGTSSLSLLLLTLVAFGCE